MWAFTDQFAWGTLSMSAAVAGLFFLRYWRDSADRLFVSFAFAFWLLGLNWLLLGLLEPSPQDRQMLFLLRLAAFLLIGVGILDKNVRAHRPRTPSSDAG